VIAKSWADSGSTLSWGVTFSFLFFSFFLLILGGFLYRFPSIPFPFFVTYCRFTHTPKSQATKWDKDGWYLQTTVCIGIQPSIFSHRTLLMRFFRFQRSKFGCCTIVSLPCCRCVLLSQVIGKRTRPWLRPREDKSPTPLLSLFNPSSYLVSHLLSEILQLKNSSFSAF
jgi:hypothetical protein